MQLHVQYEGLEEALNKTFKDFLEVHKLDPFALRFVWTSDEGLYINSSHRSDLVEARFVALDYVERRNASKAFMGHLEHDLKKRLEALSDLELEGEARGLDVKALDYAAIVAEVERRRRLQAHEDSPR